MLTNKAPIHDNGEYYDFILTIVKLIESRFEADEDEIYSFMIHLIGTYISIDDVKVDDYCTDLHTALGRWKTLKTEFLEHGRH